MVDVANRRCEADNCHKVRSANALRIAFAVSPLQEVLPELLLRMALAIMQEAHGRDYLPSNAEQSDTCWGMHMLIN